MRIRIEQTADEALTPDRAVKALHAVAKALSGACHEARVIERLLRARVPPELGAADSMAGDRSVFTGATGPQMAAGLKPPPIPDVSSEMRTALEMEAHRAPPNRRTREELNIPHDVSHMPPRPIVVDNAALGAGAGADAGGAERRQRGRSARLTLDAAAARAATASALPSWRPTGED